MQRDHPIPEFLAKRGIRSVSDNVPVGGQVQAPAGRLMALFGKEVLAACTRPPETPSQEGEK